MFKAIQPEAIQEVAMKILVGYDGSTAARLALQLAGKRARMWGAKIEVVNCMARKRELEYEDIQRLEHKLARELHDQCGADGTQYETHLLISGRQPGEDLVQFAEHNKIDEIVIGLKKRSKAGKLLFGSTAQYVILNAPCPVVSVK
jgi:nucleotide-binding universal stress UspA family protein